MKKKTFTATFVLYFCLSSALAVAATKNLDPSLERLGDMQCDISRTDSQSKITKHLKNIKVSFAEGKDTKTYFVTTRDLIVDLDKVEIRSYGVLKLIDQSTQLLISSLGKSKTGISISVSMAGPFYADTLQAPPLSTALAFNASPFALWDSTSKIIVICQSPSL